MKKISSICFFLLLFTSCIYPQAIVKEFLTYPLGANKTQIEEILKEKRISYNCTENSIIAICKNNMYKGFPIKTITFVFKEEKINNMIVRLEDDMKNNLSPKKFEGSIINANRSRYDLVYVYANKFSEMDNNENCPSMKWCYSDIIGTTFEYTAYYKDILEYEISITPINCNNTKYNVIDGFEDLKLFMSQKECEQIMKNYSWKQENRYNSNLITYKPKKRDQNLNGLVLSKIDMSFDEKGLNEIIIYSPYPGLYNYYTELRDCNQLYSTIGQRFYLEDGSVFIYLFQAYKDTRIIIGRPKFIE